MTITSSRTCPGIAAIVFQIGITPTRRWFTRRTAASLARPFSVRASAPPSISLSRRCAFAQEMGSEGIRGPLVPSVRLLSG
jgi:hypothetical protein